MVLEKTFESPLDCKAIPMFELWGHYSVVRPVQRQDGQGWSTVPHYHTFMLWD